MSKLQLDKINFNNDDFVVQFEDEISNAVVEIEEEKPQKIEVFLVFVMNFKICSCYTFLYSKVF